MIDKYYWKDCDRIVRVAKTGDIYLTRESAYKLWVDYSENYAAGWMSLPEDDDALFITLMTEVSYHRELGGLKYEI